MERQLNFLESLFPPTKTTPNVSYWKKFFDWEPRVGELARINVCVAFCRTIGCNAYCASMRVKVVDITGDTATCETTEEWQKACGLSEAGTNAAGTIWEVELADLAPILNQKQTAL